MELVGFLLVAILTSVGVLRMRRRRRVRGRAVPLGLDPRDAAELDAVAHRLLWERLGQRAGPLATRLRLILTRGVPPRALAPGGAGMPWTLTFADGSALRVRARRPADLTDLLLWLVRGRVILVGHGFEGDEVVLEFAAGQRRIRLVAVGVP